MVVRKLRERGAKNIYIPTLEEYDLTQMTDINRMLSKAKPDVIIHLAAQVGGIGANREHPAEFFYNNLMMGVQLLHRAWQTGVEKFVAIGTICAYPKFTPVPFREDEFGMDTPKKPTPYGLAKKMLLVQSQAPPAMIQRYLLLPVNLYGPGDNFNPASSHVIRH